MVLVGHLVLYFKSLLIICGLLLYNGSEAVVVDVTKTAILVADTNANDTMKLKQAFAQIIVNNTGERMEEVLQNPVFNAANIKSGVKRSYFENINPQYLVNNKHSYWFHLVMNKDFIQSVIAQAGFSVLPQNRQKIMLWVVRQEDMQADEFGEQPLKPELDYAYGDELAMYWLQYWGKVLGLVLVLPTMDEVDMLAVTPMSIKTLSFEAMTQTKNRYNIDHSLLVYIDRVGDKVKIRSGYVASGADMQIKYFQEDLVSESEILYAVMADTAEKYAGSFKIQSRDLASHTVQVVVQPIENYDAVSALKQYLDDISVIESYDIVSASLGQLVMTVNLSITTAAFLKIIGRDNVLVYNQSSSLNQLVFEINRHD